jgi:glycosyltransferase involved in cell wall biosynthesis
MAIKISVVLGSFNQQAVLKLVLDSLTKQSMPKDNYEIIVVDSSSTDGTQDFLKQYQPDNNFQYLIQENKGKAAARNRGVDLAKGEIIIITDADMIASKDLIKTHYDAHQRFEEPSCFEGLTYNMNKLEWPTTDVNLSRYIKRDYKEYKKLGWYYFLTGNISFPKKVFNDFKGFDETFLSYGWEDLELGYRLSKKQCALYYLKRAINYHYHVVSREEEIERNIKKGYSANIFLKKHPELKWFLGLNPLSVIIFNFLQKRPKFYDFVYQYFFNSKISILDRFGFWFLKEYKYLTGLLAHNI